MRTVVMGFEVEAVLPAVAVADGHEKTASATAAAPVIGAQILAFLIFISSGSCSQSRGGRAELAAPTSDVSQLRQFALGEHEQLEPHLQDEAGVPHLQFGPQRQGSQLHCLDMMFSQVGGEHRIVDREFRGLNVAAIL